MARYSAQFRNSILKKMMPPESRSAADLAAEYGITVSTIYNWDQLSIQEADKVITFGEYSKDFFTDSCKLTLRRQASNKPISPEILKAKRGLLLNHLQPQFGLNMELLPD